MFFSGPLGPNSTKTKRRKIPMTSARNQPLTTDDIARLAPSALAREASDGMSQRYTYIPTIDVIDGMREAGFLPFRATQSGTRDTSRSEHTKHMIRFRHADSLPSVAVGDSLVEVVLVNSHDGTSSYKLMAGIVRLVCWNGMVVGEIKARPVDIVFTDRLLAVFYKP
jgi:hypothetical protein